MALTFTAPERTAIAAAHNNQYVKLELRDVDGTWVDVSSALGDGLTDFLNDATLEEDIESNSMSLNVSLLRDDGTVQSLAPLREDSTLNRDVADEYAPFLDVARQWRLSVAVVGHGVAVVPGDWKEQGAGTYDVIDTQHPSPVIQIFGRDWGATLLDCWIQEERNYGSNDDPIPMEDVIQQMLDDNLGAGSVTLYTPDSPLFEMVAWKQGTMSLMAAINEVAAKAAMVCKYRYDAAGVLRLTLYAPDREAAPGDEVWTIGPAEYTALPSARIDLKSVRNYVMLRYDDEDTGKIETVTSIDATSVTRYGGPNGIARVLQVDLSKDTNIRTAARAQLLADAMRSDLSQPSMEQQFELTGFWIPQLGDYGKFLANGVHYDTDQYGGVTRISKRFAGGTMKVTLSVRGQPAGRYRSWYTGMKYVGTKANIGAPTLAIKNLREIARTPTEVTLGWRVEGIASELWLYLNTETQPVPSDPWPDIETEQPTVRLEATDVEYTFALPTNGSITFAVLVPIDKNAIMGKPLEITVQPNDLVPIINGTYQQAGADGLHRDLYFFVEDPAGVAGTLRVWTNHASSDDADSTGAIEGTLAIATHTAPVAVGPTDLFTLTLGGTSNLLNEIRVHPGKGKRVFAEYVNANGVSSGVQPIVIQSGSGPVDENNALIAGIIDSYTPFASSIRPYKIVAALPVSGEFSGQIVFLTTDSKLYRWTGAAWTAAVPTVDLTGQIQTAQIADAAVEAAKIGAAAVQTVNLALLAVTTAILAANAVTTTKITDDAVTTPKVVAAAITTAKIAAGAVTANEIFANTITAAQIAAGTITATQIAAATITGGKIAANTITASNIAADTITANEIAANAITSNELAANSVIAGKIAAAVITATEIAAATITGGKIAAGTITASNITAGTITATEIAANTITAAKIAAGTITATELAAASVTASKINVSTLSAITAEVGALVVTNGVSDITFKDGSDTIAIQDAFVSGALSGIQWDVYEIGGAGTGGMAFYWDGGRGYVVLGVNAIIGVTTFEFNTKTMSEGAANSGGAGFKLLRVPN